MKNTICVIFVLAFMAVYKLDSQDQRYYDSIRERILSYKPPMTIQMITERLEITMLREVLRNQDTIKMLLRQKNAPK